MGPDFLGNSCSNTLRSSCSQLKWPLMGKSNHTINTIIQRCLNIKLGYTKVHLMKQNTFYLSHPIYLFCHTLLASVPLLFSSLPSRFSLFVSNREKNRTDSLSPWLPCMVSWATEQHLSQTLPSSVSCLSISWPPVPNTQPLWPVSGQSSGVSSPQAKATNLHITELRLYSGQCFAGQTLAVVATM